MKKIFFCYLVLLLTSCVETVVVGTVTTGVLVAREKSIIDTKDDIRITSEVFQQFVLNDINNFNNSISVTTGEKRVLLTGVSYQPEDAKKASQLCWKVDGVKEVIDEIQVAENKPRMEKRIINYIKDSAITSQINIKATFNRDISLVNFKIITVNGVVYLMGIAQDNAEIDEITILSSKIKGVKKVISHIITTQDQRRNY